jgi:hypothetical protein
VAEGRAAKLNDVVLKIDANASDEGKLFGSIGPREIADAVTATGVELEKAEVIMGEGPIRATGAYDIPIQLHADVVADIKVIVNEDAIIAEADEAEAEEVLDYDAAEAQVVETVIDDDAMEEITSEAEESVAEAEAAETEDPETETPAS